MNDHAALPDDPEALKHIADHPVNRVDELLPWNLRDIAPVDATDASA